MTPLQKKATAARIDKKLDEKIDVGTAYAGVKAEVVDAIAFSLIEGVNQSNVKEASMTDYKMFKDMAKPYVDVIVDRALTKIFPKETIIKMDMNFLVKYVVDQLWNGDGKEVIGIGNILKSSEMKRNKAMRENMING